LTTVKRSLVKTTIKEIYNSRRNTAAHAHIQLPKLRNAVYSASSVKKVKLQKVLAIYGLDDKSKMIRQETKKEDVIEDDTDEREFETLFEWAKDLDEDLDASFLADYKHKIDYLY
jgi:hypothetical protein